MERATARVAPTAGAIIGSFTSRCVVENLNFIKKDGLNETGKIFGRILDGKAFFSFSITIMRVSIDK